MKRVLVAVSLIAIASPSSSEEDLRERFRGPTWDGRGPLGSRPDKPPAGASGRPERQFDYDLKTQKKDEGGPPPTSSGASPTRTTRSPSPSATSPEKPAAQPDSGGSASSGRQNFKYDLRTNKKM